MSINKRDIWPFYIILLPIFFIWHTYNEYFGLITVEYLLEYLLFYSGISLLLFVISYLLLKDGKRAGCFTVYCMFFILFWGAFHDTIKSLAGTSFFSSYKFLFPSIAVLAIMYVVVLRRKAAFALQINYFFNILLAILVVVEFVISLYKLTTGQIEKNDYAYNNHKENIITTKLNNAEKPDIFFIIFDEYASSKSLKKYNNFDNSRFDSALLANNFYIAVNSKSNYNSTPISLPSALNFDYFPQDFGSLKGNPMNSLKGQFSIKKSSLPKILAKNGYSIINLGLCDFENYPTGFSPHFNQDIPRIFTLNTIWGRISSEILWNFNIAILNKFVVAKKKKGIKNIADRNTYNFSKILQELNKQDKTPKFVFCHIMAPHFPYIFDNSGKQREFNHLDYLIRDSLYTNQLSYTNTLIAPLINATNQNFPRPRAIIFAGDHGRRGDDLKTGNNNFEKHFMNLNAFYFSDYQYDSVYDSISLVNNFRVVLNKYFKANIPLLKDSVIKLQRW